MIREKAYEVLTGIVLVVLGLLLIFTSGCSQTTFKTRYEVVSAFAKSEVSGSFFLGCGRIGTEEYYFGFVKTKEGLRRFKAPTRLTVIIETSKYKPHILFIERAINNPHKYLRGQVWWADKIYLYVPKNTIIRRFKIK